MTTPTSLPADAVRFPIVRELLCQMCGRDYPVWVADSDLWNDVMRRGVRANADDFEFVCPTCFTVKACFMGISPIFQLRIAAYEETTMRTGKEVRPMTGNALRRARAYLGYTQTQMATAMDVSLATFQRREALAEEYIPMVEDSHVFRLLEESTRHARALDDARRTPQIDAAKERI